MNYLTKIDAERAKQKITMEELAKKTGLSVDTIKRLLSRSAGANANVESVVALCNALGLSVAGVFATDYEVVIQAKAEDVAVFEAIQKKPFKIKAVLLELLECITK